MSEAKFKKGPWYFVHDNDLCPEIAHVYNDNDTEICTMYIGMVDENANLISKAPEMYAMLEEVRKLVYMHGDEAIDWIETNFRRIEELLASARGEE